MASKKSRKSGSPSQTARGTRRTGAGTARRDAAYHGTAMEPPAAHESVTPAEHYRREKARRAAERRGTAADPLEEARREYRAMLAADAARQKGGRPKKTSEHRPDSGEDAELERGGPEPSEEDRGGHDR